MPPPDPRVARPETLGEARLYIRETYLGNDWDREEQKRFEKIAGVDPKEELEEYSPAEMKKILGRMETSRMILFKK